MDRRQLYDLCSECKYANRNKGGIALGCLIRGPRIFQDKCEDFTLWWTKPPTQPFYKSKVFLVLAPLFAILAFVPLIFVGFFRLLKWIAPKINKEALSLYFPGRR